MNPQFFNVALRFCDSRESDKVKDEHSNPTRELQKKICLLGDAAVGKTSLIRRYVYDRFDDNYIDTIGAKVTGKMMIYQREDDVINLTMMIWDIAGQKMSQKIHSAYYWGADGAILVCDMTRASTFDSLGEWLDALYSITGRIPLVIVGNKMDLKGEIEVKKELLEDLAAEMKGISVFTSAKSGENVEDTFRKIGRMIISRHLDNTPDED